MAGNMAVRVAVAVVAIPVAGAAVWQGGVVLAGLLALVAGLGARELSALAGQHGVRPHRLFASASAAAIPLLVWRGVTGPGGAGLSADLFYGAALWLLAVLLLTLWRRQAAHRPLAAAAVTVLAPLYAGGLLAFALVLRHGTGHGLQSWPGLALVFFPLATTWVCDSLAMEVGRRVGGPRLAPDVSPGKTWSGAIGGFVGALAGALAYNHFLLAALGLAVTPWQALLVGGVAGVVGQLGDLAESLLKREAGVKDSGRLLPGHGGVLDRLDSLYFVLPATAVLYRAFGLL